MEFPPPETIAFTLETDSEYQDLQTNRFQRIYLAITFMQPEASRLPVPAAEKSSWARARSLPVRSSFVWSTIWTALFFLGVFALLTCLVLFFSSPGRLTIKFLLGSLAFTIAAWTCSFIKRRETFCPLCRGTPLINSGARAHERAVRIPPLNHGITATVSILASQRFCCMYCGTTYDLLKPRRKRGNAGEPDQDSLN